MQGCGIIYCLTTAATEETTEWLRDWDIAADFYHGQRTKSDRERVQNGFMSGELRVIAATNAFGLGIDKPDVRFVIHRDVPASLEAYFQEAGRAGRDGEPARCTLIYRPADLGRAAFLAAGSTVSAEDLGLIRESLREQPESTVAELTERIEPGAAKVRRALETLARRGVVELEGESVRLLRPSFDPEKVSLEAEESRKAYEKSRVQIMRGYAESWDCRRHSLLSYFGEELEAESCDYCDNDCRLDRRGAPMPEPEEESPIQVGAQVRHTGWGSGEVIACENGAITVNFQQEGEKTLAAELVLERELLEVIAAPEPGMTPAIMSEEAPFQVGERVEHKSYGAGEVQRITEAAVVVLFEKAGYHTLDLERVQEQALLTGTAEP
jgi:ATP-dependent DNA helicase RecQ